jgi:hypothetical protein
VEVQAKSTGIDQAPWHPSFHAVRHRRWLHAMSVLDPNPETPRCDLHALARAERLAGDWSGSRAGPLFLLLEPPLELRMMSSG